MRPLPPLIKGTSRSLNRAIAIERSGHLTATKIRDPSRPDFFARWGSLIGKISDTTAREQMREYVDFLRHLSDLEFDFKEILEFDARTRSEWKLHNKVEVDRVALA
eukprot:580767-Pyramimonas_sp.AAC.1